MATIQEQRKWERDMTALGVSRFRGSEDNAMSGGRYTETSAGSRLLKVYLGHVSEAISDYIDTNRKGRKNMHWKLLRGVDFDKLAMFSLHVVIGTLYKPCNVTSAARKLGSMVEDEIKFSKFEIELPEYYNAVIRDLDNRNSNQYRHRHRVLTNRMNDRQIAWNPWSPAVKVGVGMLLLSIVEANSDLVERKNVVEGRGNTQVYIAPTDKALEWVVNHNEAIETMMPDRMPCIVKPTDWTDWKTGGYYTRQLRGKTPLVKTRFGQQTDVQEPLLDAAVMPTVLNSVNAIQNTPWKINTAIRDVVTEVWQRNLEIGMPRAEPYEVRPCPLPTGRKDLTEEEKEVLASWKEEARTIYGLEADRKSDLMSVRRATLLADRLMDKELLWMVYQLDFRGRAYCTANGVSPQGNDIAKAMLHFGNAREITDAGIKWWKIHGANKYGYDKVSYDERVSWVDQRAARIIAAGIDPIANTDVWRDADKPWQFLSWCIEFSQAHSAVRDGTIANLAAFKSRQPIAMDGACNGLQHFSAMLRDPIGGAAVNLIPTDKPADIYQDVADVCYKKLEALTTQPDHPHYIVATNWLTLFNKHFGGKMPRKSAKTPVMTLPYGSTRQTCTQSLYSWYLSQKLDFFDNNTTFKHCNVLSGILWDSISEVVVAARAAMGWLQKVAGILAKHDEPIIYHSPVGFPLVQLASKEEKKQVKGQIGGACMRVTVYSQIPGVNPYKARSGSSPNFVHDIDANHLHMTVEAGLGAGITDFAMIHDDFGVHACHAEKWAEIIRRTFVDLYTKHDVLADFKKQQEERTELILPDLPEKGDLNIEDVLKSLYFFG